MVGDLVHFLPDMDPKNQNLKNRIHILPELTWNQFEHVNKIFLWWFFLPEKIEKFAKKFENAEFF